MNGKIGRIRMAEGMFRHVLGAKWYPDISALVEAAIRVAQFDHETFKADYYAKNPKGK